MRSRFLLCLAILFCAITGCAGPASQLQDSAIGYKTGDLGTPTSAFVGTRWHVVLDAVGNEQRVFDNFVSDFGNQLQTDNPRIASLQRLTASGTNPATAATLMATLKRLQPKANEACLLYLTGHGLPDKGIVFSANTPKVWMYPAELGQLLQASPCSGRPTVVVVSSCFSGVYMKANIASPDRIIITASAPDVPSFGCSDNRRYTFFDQCFMDEWQKHDTWQEMGKGIQRCVSKEESAMRMPPSYPQFFYGRNMRDLDLPKNKPAP